MSPTQKGLSSNQSLSFRPRPPLYPFLTSTPHLENGGFAFHCLCSSTWNLSSTRESSPHWTGRPHPQRPALKPPHSRHRIKQMHFLRVHSSPSVGTALPTCAVPWMQASGGKPASPPLTFPASLESPAYLSANSSTSCTLPVLTRMRPVYMYSITASTVSGSGPGSELHLRISTRPERDSEN